MPLESTLPFPALSRMSGLPLTAIMRRAGIACLVLIALASPGIRADDIVRVGLGSYTTIAPPTQSSPRL